MKKALLFVSIFSLFLTVACTTQTKQEAAAPAAPTIDTTGLAAFQEWQFQNERKDASEYMAQQTVAKEPVKVVKKKTTPKKVTPKPVETQPETPAQQDQGTVNETPSTTNESGTMGTETTSEAKKKGISTTVKSTAIGAVGGAVLAAVINKKNRVVGGIIGGVLGGGIGYGIGKKIEKNQEMN
jgi:outer membrane biosynthesis protein TonB